MQIFHHAKQATRSNIFFLGCVHVTSRSFCMMTMMIIMIMMIICIYLFVGGQKMHWIKDMFVCTYITFLHLSMHTCSLTLKEFQVPLASSSLHLRQSFFQTPYILQIQFTDLTNKIMNKVSGLPVVVLFFLVLLPYHYRIPSISVVHMSTCSCPFFSFVGLPFGLTFFYIKKVNFCIMYYVKKSIK